VCHQLEGYLGDVMAGKTKMSPRYNHAAAVAMWLRRKLVDSNEVKARIGKRPVDVEDASSEKLLPASSNAGGDGTLVARTLRKRYY